MKKTILLILILIFNASCFKTTQSRIENSVKKYILENCNDKSEYESISFDNATYGIWSTEFGDIKGWSLYHKYRISNKSGAQVIQNNLFILDTKFNVKSVNIYK